MPGTSGQAALSQSFDETSGVLSVSPVSGVPTKGGNPSGTITWTQETPTQMTKVIDGVTYTRSFTWSGGMLVSWTAWS